MKYTEEIRNMDAGSIFLPEESRILDKTLNIREKIIDEILKDGIPTDSKTVRVVNEVLNSMDALVLGKVDRRLKNEENKTNENMLELVKEVILASNNTDTVIEEREVEVDIELKDEEIVPEEDTLISTSIEFDEIKPLLYKEQ